MSDLIQLRKNISDARLVDEGILLEKLVVQAHLSGEERADIAQDAANLVTKIRQESSPSLMESFLEEYGLSTKEGIALMCLAEALLRVPDPETIDALIEDKIAPSNWAEHLGRSSSPLVNASTWALMFTGKLLDQNADSRDISAALHGAVKRLGEPLVRRAVEQAVKEMGRQFVLGQSIEDAMKRAAKNEEQGYTYSYDMLGEAARTEADAARYHLAYSDAITAIAKACNHKNIQENPGISIKLSALHPRYESIKHQRVMEELVPRVRSLALLAKSAGMGLNIDAEEMDRLHISLDIIEAVLSTPALKGWDGFGIVVQAYGRRANEVIDYLYALAKTYDRRIMVRLVKGAYWDSEIKWAQTLGLKTYPVFTRKTSTDIAYIAIARKLLAMTDCIYPQFATHNAHTVCAILKLGEGQAGNFEFQRLHGMGESVHELVKAENNTRCRIYSPVGAHQDLLAYLVRRLLENGANSSFVNQIVDEEIAPEEVARDPFLEYEHYKNHVENPQIINPSNVFWPQRKNSSGINYFDEEDMKMLLAERAQFDEQVYKKTSLVAGALLDEGRREEVINPATKKGIGEVKLASVRDVKTAFSAAKVWQSDADERAHILMNAARLFEQHRGEICALAAREAGKNVLDAIGELREAVDFLYYYAEEARRQTGNPRGVIICISPWNFPLAIFTGQISAALAAGNAVIAKPAESTPLMAIKAVELLYEAGVPKEALQLLLGEGSLIGSALCSHQDVNGVCFTGSTNTAQLIHQNLAQNASPDAMLIAETGGLNAMIVDSTALPEQAVRDILASAFQSAGQRCSALRILYLQDDIAESVLAMLYGAMDELEIANPWDLSVDVGPVIDERAYNDIAGYIEGADKRGALLKRVHVPEDGYFVTPAVIKVRGIADLEREVFGPVLHVATFKSSELSQIIEDINASGFGLTFGLHTRIDDRVQDLVDTLNVGNMYVNRNQIGAVVASQPFGGEGLSGTGPKAGGPHYVPMFYRIERALISPSDMEDEALATDVVQQAIDEATVDNTAHETVVMQGPTGESNRLSYYARGVILCCGPTEDIARQQKNEVEEMGCVGIVVGDGFNPIDSCQICGFAGVHYWGGDEKARQWRMTLASREGAILPLWCGPQPPHSYYLERHVCIDVTSSGGNAELLMISG